MPHITVNYSAQLIDLDQQKLLQEINTSLIATALFDANDIKSRIFKDEMFLIGLGDVQDAYIHLKLYLLSGRSAAQKQTLGQDLLKALEQKKYLKSEFEFPIQLCIEVIDMPKENYFKGIT
ncbi:5-carboxymethyl-2-hydroxymuconate Delta-isomerase [Acinetobacter haemolyticus]|uniref:5-carboxymethyl-2-hydroxymuconate Delta-isomerase n=1 Tax=Acinetobacter haemolyticus TaxID=29430 RepID=UPI000F745F69|nr:5-carboxymethyl-2-hydroxymuconate Delta-isomerase [Acinetobacter haemolyticus]RSN75856.1 5-carboxymethyl-2-hydroxymuconate Delta-isomerase [Acinetobacter haemolyticus]